MNLEKQLLKELEDAREASSRAFNECPPDLDYNGFMGFMEETNKKVSKASRAYRMVQTPNFSELPTYGDVMSLDDFIDNVKSGGFIDYDGFGHYVKDELESDIIIYPSDVKHYAIRKDFDTIVWYNR